MQGEKLLKSGYVFRVLEKFFEAVGQNLRLLWDKNWITVKGVKLVRFERVI